MSNEFPVAIAEVDAQWLTRTLRQARALPQGRVAAVERDPIDEPGQTGDVERLILVLDGAPEDAPRSLVAKVAPSFEGVRQQMHAMGWYESEIRFYQELGADPGISVPRCYFADIDREHGHFMLLLEDMSACRTGDLWVTSFDDVRVAVEHVAAFHAKWWQSPMLWNTPWIRRPDDREYNQVMLGAMLRGCLPVVEQRWPDHFAGYLRDIARRLVERWEWFIDNRAARPVTLVHNDYHPKQMFFPTERGGRFAVFDWQGPAAAPATSDLARVLMMGLRPAELALHRDALIALYQRRLSECGVQLSIDELTHSTREAMLVNLFIAVFAGATTDVSILEQAASARGVDYRERCFSDLSQVLEANRVHEFLE